MNNKKVAVLLMVAVVLAVGIPSVFAAEKVTDKPVMLAADKVLKMAPDNGYFRYKLEDLKMKVDSKAMDFVIVDVRPTKLFQTERIMGSMNIPLPSLVDNLTMIPMDKTIYVVCAVDGNSAYATLTLRMLGYTAFMIPGGEVAWKQAGYPVESDNTIK
jgi:rhodanese-related sulfurtransferase